MGEHLDALLGEPWVSTVWMVGHFGEGWDGHLASWQLGMTVVYSDYSLVVLLVPEKDLIPPALVLGP